MEKLRKRNAEIDAMGQVFQGDALAQVLEHTKVLYPTNRTKKVGKYNEIIIDSDESKSAYKKLENWFESRGLQMPNIGEWQTMEFKVQDFYEWFADGNSLDFEDFIYEMGDSDTEPILDGLTEEQYAKKHNITFDEDFETWWSECVGETQSSDTWEWVDMCRDDDNDAEKEQEAGAPAPAPSPPAAKRTYKCSVCGITGHNKTTCPQKK